MFKNLLVAIGGSNSSLVALDRAICLGKLTEAKINVLSVAPEAIIRIPTNISDEDEDLNEDVYNITKKILERARSILESYPYTYTCQYRTGDPAREIVAYADEIGADLIVIGNRDLGFVSRTILGSVSKKVIDTANVCVLVAKEKDKDND
ncbi:MAG: universal stress protein [Bacillota bacterium]|nr:universal stress protein [Bacillota bacterium]